MSSILTNNGAMVALQTLKSINMNLATTQGEISTGKSVANAKDNAAVWAISKVMEADVKGFKGISDSLNLGQSTVAVARQAAETVTELLTDVKGKIVAAQEENVDRAKIQADIDALRGQIGAVVSAAQFNGLNLLSNIEETVGSGSINVLASLDRSGTGVAASDINVSKQDLGTGAAEIAGTVAATALTASVDSVSLAAVQSDTIDIGTTNSGFTAGTAYTLTVFGTDADNSKFTQADYRETTAAGPTAAEVSGLSIVYVAREGDTAADVAKGLHASFKSFMAENELDTDVVDATVSGDTLTFTSTLTDATDTIAVTMSSVDASEGNTIGGKLEQLSNLDVTTQSGVDSALDQIEGLIQTAIDSAAAFGSTQGRIETQTEFISGLTDALKSGIGTLVDADMEEASARLQALQVQQQLGVQALSIANQAPQSLLSLFR
ncbi:flagellin [Alloyangia pacifica]|uniref:flagellin N-terminal helical domain-containing protein n=1 Tax=Alloyangia pacifica TaxID=311180 RepID=UPI001CD20A9F|nr:flagellin [Alloyangia pacifica]MCA0995426.1 flagellin [Alloyangia pacifica]